VTAGIHNSPQGQTTIKLAVPPKKEAGGEGFGEKLLSPFPNCNAVENRPTIAWIHPVLDL